MSPQDSSMKGRFFTVATAGHVDHGKTSLLKALTGIDPDRLKEEKERQMTTDLGFAHLRLADDLVVGFIDVPGHGKFLKNMLAGVGGIDMALLVVAADEGPMPQTYQHLKILSLLGVKSVLVTITKCDLADAVRSEEVGSLVSSMVLEHRMEVIGCAHVSSTKMRGLDELQRLLIDGLGRLPARSPAGSTFLPIDRVFTKAGFGTVVTGTLVRGVLQVGDQVKIEPGSQKARVRRLESFGQAVDCARAGQRVAGNLVIKDGGALARGQVILVQDLVPSTVLLVSLEGWSEEERKGLAERLSGQPIRLYHGTAECHGEVRWVEELEAAEPGGGGSQRHFIAQLAMSDPVVAEPRDRYVIRLTDETIYGGAVLLRDKPRWLTRPRLKALAFDLLRSNLGAAVVSYVQWCPQHMIKESHLEKLVPGDTKPSVVQGLVEARQMVKLGEYLLTSSIHAELGKRLLAEMREYSSGTTGGVERREVPLEHLRTRVMPAVDRSAFQCLVQAISESGAIVRCGDRLALPESGAARTPDSDALDLRNKIVKILGEQLCLEISELARLCGASERKVRNALDELAKEGTAAIVSYEFAALISSIDQSHQLLATIWQEKKEITPSEFRERLGVSRKYVMALLAYFDDHQVTRRVEAGRVLLKMPRAR